MPLLPPRLRPAVALVVTGLALLLLATTAPSATAAGQFPRQFDWTLRTATVRHQWTELSRTYPQRCKAWLKNRSFIEQKSTGASGSMKVEDNGSYEYGNVEEDKLRGTIERVITVRGHSVPDTPACSPCGPLSEYGPCRGERPDITYHDTCGPKDGRFEWYMMLNGAQLLVRPGMPNDSLESCPELDGLYAHEGPSDDISVDTVILPSGGRQLLRLGVGARRTLEVTDRKGRCDRLGKVGMHSCVTVKATIVVRRTR